MSQDENNSLIINKAKNGGTVVRLKGGDPFIFGRGGEKGFGYYETICGGAGAGPDFDGADAVHTHMTNTRITDPEILEDRYPVRLRQFLIRRGSGGEGRHCGGNGIIRQIEFLEPATVSLLTQRRSRAPYGLQDGQAGCPGENLIRRAGSDTDEKLDASIQFEVSHGDVVTILTPGGGGYGPRPVSGHQTA
jgi:5-oxoprolinase (ATP-hydrolysing)